MLRGDGRFNVILRNVGAAFVGTHTAAVITVTAYVIADSSQGFAPHLSPGDVRAMAEKSDNGAGYDYLKKTGTLP
jgi:hypothetical protein